MLREYVLVDSSLLYICIYICMYNFIHNKFHMVRSLKGKYLGIAVVIAAHTQTVHTRALS